MDALTLVSAAVALSSAAVAAVLGDWAQRRLRAIDHRSKTKMREDAEVKRARQAEQLCEADHPAAHETYTREAHEEER